MLTYYELIRSVRWLILLACLGSLGLSYGEVSPAWITVLVVRPLIWVFYLLPVWLWLTPCAYVMKEVYKNFRLRGVPPSK